MFIFFFITLLSAIQCDKLETKWYTVEDAFECINSVTLTTEHAITMRDNVKELFNTYVFKDIMKNPPQPFENEEFFLTLDIDNALDNLPTENNQNAYLFMQKMQAIVDTCRDLHLSFRLTSNETKFMYYYDNFIATLPFSFDIVDGEYILNIEEYIEMYNVTISEALRNCDGKAVQSINGLNPHDYIKNFAEKYTFLKSPHGRFTYALESMNFMSLRRTLLPEEFLKEKIVIEMKDGNSVETGYVMVYNKPEDISEQAQRKLKIKEEINFAPLNIKDFFSAEHIKKFEEKNQFLKSKLKADNEYYTYESADKNLACLVDLERKVNVIVLKTFYPEVETVNFFTLFNKCINDIDKNTNPIIVILPMNGGGYADLEANFEETLAPHSDVDLIGSVRISKGSEGCMKNEYGLFLYDTEKCQPLVENTSLPLGDFYTNYKTAYYGDVAHHYSQESLMHASTMLAARLVNNPRNPTDIVVFTDGFCYSACSVLAKGMKDKGGAIVVGFEGDPELGIEYFDAGNSPTPVITQDEVFIEEAKKLDEIGGYMRISYYETFEWNYNYDQTIPREFILNIVDERVSISRFADEKLNQFIDEGLNIIDKYKTKCNPENDILTKVDATCDEKMTIEHTHGGFKCTEEGVWSTECSPSYCDEGFKWDKWNKKCIVDVCYGEEQEESSEEPQPEPEPEPEPTPDPEPEPTPAKSEESESEMDEQTMWIIIGSCVGGFVLILVIVGVVVGIIMCKKKRNNSEYKLLE